MLSLAKKENISDIAKSLPEKNLSQLFQKDTTKAIDKNNNEEFSG